MGMAVQLGALAFLNRLAPRHYLVTTAIAIEVTLLHNFVWHMHYTWKDRTEGSAWTQLVRFQLANGVVSMVGNLVLMRLLVRDARMPVVAANAIAILCCSLLNFLLGNTWAFAPAPRLVKRSRS
jgi:putative flippase GtrA